MSLFVRRDRATRASSSEIDQLIPARASTTPVSVTTSTQAMQHTTVWACVTLITDLVSMMPVDEFTTINGEQVQVDPSEITVAPSGLVDGPGWVTQSLTAQLLEGNAVGLITDVTRRGWPAKVEWLTSQQASPTIKDGELFWRTPWGLLRPKVDVVHAPAYVLNGSPIGLSAIGHFRRTLGIGLSAEDFGARWYSEGGHPSAIVTSDDDLSADQATAIKKSVRNTIAGTREVAVFGGGLKYLPIQIPPGESLFLQTIGANAATISGQIYRCPPALFGIAQQGGGGMIEYSNREQRILDFLMMCLGPWIRRVERMWSALLPRGRYVKLNRGVLLETDLMTRYKSYEIGLRNGFLSPNEVRALENRQGIGPAGDTYERSATPTSAPTQP